MIDLGRISSFTWQKSLKIFFGFWKILWWRKIWTQALKNHFPRDIDGTTLWVGSLILWHLPLSYGMWFRRMRNFQIFDHSEGSGNHEERTWKMKSLKNEEELNQIQYIILRLRLICVAWYWVWKDQKADNFFPCETQGKFSIRLWRTRSPEIIKRRL